MKSLPVTIILTCETEFHMGRAAIPDAACEQPARRGQASWASPQGAPPACGSTCLPASWRRAARRGSCRMGAWKGLSITSSAPPGPRRGVQDLVRELPIGRTTPPAGNYRHVPVICASGRATGPPARRPARARRPSSNTPRSPRRLSAPPAPASSRYESRAIAAPGRSIAAAGARPIPRQTVPAAPRAAGAMKDCS
jgi:hypothetical protein